jgi:ribonuclease HI
MPDSPEDREILLTLARQLPEEFLKEVLPEVPPETIRQILIGLAGEAPSLEKPAQQSLFSKPAAKKEVGSCHLYTDGAARGNPGEAGAGAVLIGPEGTELGTRSLYLGQCTNNVAEYYALLAGLELAEKHGCKQLQICLDSELIVRQIQGVYKVKNEHLKPLFGQVKNYLARLDNWLVKHVPRSENVRADELANRGIDEK